jgi:hypothetical protein
MVPDLERPANSAQGFEPLISTWKILADDDRKPAAPDRCRQNENCYDRNFALSRVMVAPIALPSPPQANASDGALHFCDRQSLRGRWREKDRAK